MYALFLIFLKKMKIFGLFAVGEIEEPKTNIGIKSNGATGGDSGNVIPFPSNGNVIPFPIKGKRGGSGNVIPFPRCGGRGGNVIDFPSGS
jgi:hypothetical protein